MDYSKCRESRRIAVDVACRAKAAFTLMELLVVIAIIAILAAILLPVFASVRRDARKTTAINNLARIGKAVLMYNQDYDEFFPRTQESTTPGEPTFINYWTAHYYQTSLNPYIAMGKGGINSNGSDADHDSVWYDPQDPDKDIPVMWGSFSNNGLVTGTTRQLSQISRPGSTIISMLRTPKYSYFTDWQSGYEAATPDCAADALPNPLPLSNPNDPFWQSNFFDICLNPWGANEDPLTGTTDPFYWKNGKATPPADLFPTAAHTDASDASYWSNGVDGRFFPNIPCSPYTSGPDPRYPSGQAYLFCDGHAAFMPFTATYEGINDNMWSTDQETLLPLVPYQHS